MNPTEKIANRAFAITGFLAGSASVFGDRLDDFFKILEMPIKQNQSLEFWTNTVVGIDDMYSSTDACETKTHMANLLSFVTAMPFLWTTIESDGLSACITGMSSAMSGTKDILGSVLSAMRYFLVHGSAYLLGDEYDLAHKSVSKDVDKLLAQLIKMDAEQLGGTTPYTISQVVEIERNTFRVMDAALKRGATVRSPVLRASYFSKAKEIKLYWLKIRSQLLANKQKAPPFVVSLTGAAGTGKSTVLPMIQNALHYVSGLLQNMRVAAYSQRDKWDSNMSILTTGVNADDPYQRNPTDENNFFAWVIDYVNPNPMPLVKADVDSKEGQFLLADFFCMSNNKDYIDLSSHITHEAAYYRRLACNFEVIPMDKYFVNGTLDKPAIKAEFGDDFTTPPKYCVYQEYTWELKENTKPKRINVGSPITYDNFLPRIVEIYKTFKLHNMAAAVTPVKDCDFCEVHGVQKSCCPCVEYAMKREGVRKMSFLNQMLGVNPYRLKNSKRIDEARIAYLRHITHLHILYKEHYDTTELPFTMKNLWRIRKRLIQKGVTFKDERILPSLCTYNILGIPAGIGKRRVRSFMLLCVAKDRMLKQLMLGDHSVLFRRFTKPLSAQTDSSFVLAKYLKDQGLNLRDFSQFPSSEVPTETETSSRSHKLGICLPKSGSYHTTGHFRAHIWYRIRSTKKWKISTTFVPHEFLEQCHSNHRERQLERDQDNRDFEMGVGGGHVLTETGRTSLDAINEDVAMTAIYLQDHTDQDLQESAETIETESTLSSEQTMLQRYIGQRDRKINEAQSWRDYMGRSHHFDTIFNVAVVEAVLSIDKPFYDEKEDDAITTEDFWTDVKRYINTFPKTEVEPEEEHFVSQLESYYSPGAILPTPTYIFTKYKQYVYDATSRNTRKPISYLEILRICAHSMRQIPICSADDVDLDTISVELASALFNLKINQAPVYGFNMPSILATYFQCKLGENIPCLFEGGSDREAVITTLTTLASLSIAVVTIPVCGPLMGVAAAATSGSLMALTIWRATSFSKGPLEEMTKKEELINLMAHMGCICPLFLLLRYIFSKVDDTKMHQGISFVTGNSVSVVKRQEIKDGKKPESWGKMDASAHVHLSEEARTGTQDHLKAKVKENLFAMSIDTVSVTVLFIAPNYALMPGHIFKTKKKFTGMLIGSKTNSHFRATINEGDGVFLQDKDIWIGYVVGGVGLNDLTKYLPQSVPTGAIYCELIRNTSGLFTENSGVAKFEKTGITSGEDYWGTVAELYSPTRQGDCGSPMICKQGKNSFIGSFHLGYDTAHKTAIGVTLLPMDVIIAIAELSDKGFGPPILDQSHPVADAIEGKKYSSTKNAPKHLVNFQLPTNGKQGTDVLSIARFEANKMVPHPDETILKQFKHFDDLAPAVFSKRDNWKYVTEMGASCPPIDSEIVRKAIRSYWVKLEHLPCTMTGILTFKQAWHGIPGVEHINSVDETTGAGLPYSMNKQKLLSVLGLEEIEKVTEKVIERLKDGECPGWVFDVVTKQELRSVGKDARKHTAGGITNLMTLKMYGSTTMKFFLDSPLESCVAMGLDPQSKDWDDLFNMLTIHGTERFQNTDYKAFDRTIPMMFKHGAVALILLVSKTHAKLNEDEMNVLTKSLYYCCEPKYLVNGVVMSFEVGQASGWFFTALFNCVVNILIRRASFLTRFPDLNYDHNVRETTLGDDVMATVSPAVEWTCVHLVEDLAAWNITVTSPDKEEVKPFYTVLESDFLNRKFTRPYGCKYVIGALKINSIFKNLNGIVPSKSIAVEKQVVDAYRSSIELAWPHGKAVYDRTVSIISRAVASRKTTLGFAVLTYQEIVTLRVGWNPTSKVFNPEPWLDNQDTGWFRQLFRSHQSPMENTEFIEEDTPVVVDNAVHDPTSSMTAVENLPIENTFMRPFLIHTVEVSTSFTNEINPFALMLSQPNVFEKLRLKAMIRCDLLLTLVLSGNKFMKGGVIASYSPIDVVEDPLKYPKDSLTLETQKPCMILRVGENEKGEMTLPWIWHNPAITLKDTTVFDEMGTLRLSQFSTISTVGGALATSTLQIFASLTNLELAGNSRVNQVKFSSVMGGISKVASLASKFPIPPLATVADMVSKSADTIGSLARTMGYSRPAETANPIYSYRSGGIMAPVDGPDNSVPLALTMTNSHSIDPRIVGAETDDMIFTNISSIPSYVGAFSWSDGSPPGTVLTRIRVTPTLCTAYAPTKWALSASAVVATPFKFWRGEMLLNIKLFATSFHGGKLLISYDPSSTAVGLETHITENHIVDVADLRDFDLNIKWGQPNGIQMVDHDFPRIGPGTALNNTTDNGIVTIMVINQLNAMLGTDETVEGTIMTSFPEIMFAAPSFPYHKMSQTPSLLNAKANWMDPHSALYKGETKLISSRFTIPACSNEGDNDIFIVVECFHGIQITCEGKTLTAPKGINCLHFAVEPSEHDHDVKADKPFMIRAVKVLRPEYTYGSMKVTEYSGEIISERIDTSHSIYLVNSEKTWPVYNSIDVTDADRVLAFGLDCDFIPPKYSNLITHLVKTAEVLEKLRIAFHGDFLYCGKTVKCTPNITFGKISQAETLQGTVSEANASAEEVAKIYSGEIVTTIRSMIKRYYKTQTIIAETTVLPLYPLDWVENPSPYSWFGACFLGIRGNTRWKIFPVANAYTETCIYDTVLAEEWDGVQASSGEPLTVEIPAYLRRKFHLARGPVGQAQYYHHLKVTSTAPPNSIFYAAGEDISLSIYMGPPLITQI